MTGPSTPLLVTGIAVSILASVGLLVLGDVPGFLSVAVVGLTWFAVLRMNHRAPTAPVPEKSYAGILAELTHSRREIVGAFEIERRRIERDLHDGAQQYLVAAAIKVGEASLDVDPASAAGKLLLAAQDDADQALKALRNTVHGIRPQALTDLGLEAAVKELAARFPGVQVRCPHQLPPLPQGILSSGYFFVSEALTNTAKHAPGAEVVVLLTTAENLRITITDTGPGGAVVRSGHGLSGMRERLAAFGGTVTISSPSGGPTQVLATMPLLLGPGQSAYTDQTKDART